MKMQHMAQFPPGVEVSIVEKRTPTYFQSTGST